MRLLAIADTHLGYETGKSSEARNFTYERMFHVFEEIHQLAKKNQVDAIVHAGDLFNRSKPRKKAVKRAFDIIEEILLDDIQFLIVPGNHERSRLPLSLLNFHQKCHFFSKLSNVTFGSCSIIGFPYQSGNISKLFLAINKLTQKIDSKCSIILCHQLFVGATFGPHQFMFKESHGAININNFTSNICLFITGHVHRAQMLNGGQVVYPGALERTSFVESIEPKGYLLIDIEDSNLKVNFHQLQSSPMSVLEINLVTHELNMDELHEKIMPGLSRTLLRLVGRSITTDELESIKLLFPPKDYPLFVISPRFPGQIVKPLYDKCIPFEFPAFIRKF